LPAMFSNLSDALPHLASGAVRALAVSSDQRTRLLPEAPTLPEAGFPGYRAITWNGAMAPAGTPQSIIDKTASEIARRRRNAKFVERLAALGADPLGNTPEEFAALIASDLKLWSEAVAVAGIKSD
jgi:tripartite-type tricarboxylate transporter receptor subunit TctC